MTIIIPAPAFFDLLSFFLGAATLLAALYGVDVLRDWRRNAKWRASEKKRRRAQTPEES